MSRLDYEWIGELNDGRIIRQYDEKGEHSFALILDKMEELKYFTLQHISKPIKFIVDMKTALIHKDLVTDMVIDKLMDRKIFNVEVSNFRVNICEINSSLQPISKKIWYCLEVSYYDENQIKRDLVLQLDNDGNQIITAN